MVESFYSVWKPEAKHIVTIVNIPHDKHNEVYSLAVRLAAAMYGEEPIPFIINVGTKEVITSYSSDDESLDIDPIT
jgi:hypothetical protein